MLTNTSRHQRKKFAFLGYILIVTKVPIHILKQRFDKRRFFLYKTRFYLGLESGRDVGFEEVTPF